MNTALTPTAAKVGTPVTKSHRSRTSTATEAQYERIVMLLKSGTKTTFDFHKAGIAHPSMRIKEMNDRMGYYIPTIDQITVFDEWGYAHPRVAVYELVDEPISELTGQINDV